jgi:DNA-binding NarL/FixJ family response regulator
MIRVVIVDDQAMVRSGFRSLLAQVPGIEVVAEASDGRAAIDAVNRHQPNVVLMDIRMPVLDGLSATRQLASEGSSTRILVLTTFDLDEYVYEALRAGASGFLLKDAPPAELIRGIEVLAAGDALLAPSVTRRLLAEFSARPASTGDDVGAVDGLTVREVEVLRLIARGYSNAEIADALVVGETTVKTHVGNILMKCGLRDRVQAVVLAYESGLVVPGDGASGPPEG